MPEDLHNAIKSTLHSQQHGLFPTQIRDLLVERKELSERYSNKESIKTAVIQALTMMIARGEVTRQEATTIKGGRSHLYILLDVAQPQSREESKDSDSKDRAKSISTKHSVMPLVDGSDLQSPRPLKVETSPSADIQPDPREIAYSEPQTSTRVGGSEHPRSVIQSVEKTSTQLQLPEEARIPQRLFPTLCAEDVANGQRSAGMHLDSLPQKFGLRASAQEFPDDGATLSLDYQEPASTRLDESEQRTEPTIEKRVSRSPDGLDRSLGDDCKTTLTELGQRVIHCRKLKGRLNRLVRDKAMIESERDDAHSALSELRSILDHDKQKLEALDKETQLLQDKTLRLKRGLSSAKRHVDEGKQIVELKTLEVHECEEIVKVIEEECSGICLELRGLVQDLDIV